MKLASFSSELKCLSHISKEPFISGTNFVSLTAPYYIKNVSELSLFEALKMGSSS